MSYNISYSELRNSVAFIYVIWHTRICLRVWIFSMHVCYQCSSGWIFQHDCGQSQLRNCDVLFHRYRYIMYPGLSTSIDGSMSRHYNVPKYLYVMYFSRQSSHNILEWGDTNNVLSRYIEWHGSVLHGYDTPCWRSTEGWAHVDLSTN